ncbi:MULTISPECIES: chemotaxis protein CheW [Clostridium]|jgi:purine-binding chemotaxis protein CheW|uniref:CheW protein n=2 Tax=Clostridium intestinale TaxID=36845 RepID=U2PZ03_9CLOT|nr:MULTISPECIES: chemotaxis protein CheW [Clostridium]ERK31735.1 CheW protein [Clostridium intestinale URNW]WRY53869.1 chemotaxis protein CheW [Clostridium intestinale]SHI04608.1 purine-binding chemotaxis protein CheW [Clostridium intestinale DSM 6191]
MSSTEMKVLIFSLNNEFYGINIMDVERILGFEKPTLIPDVPHFMEGVINYETGILPIINLKKKFSLNPQSSNDQDSKIVVTKEQTNKFGILVDNVYEVKDINTSSIEMSKAITSAISGRYIEGLIKLEDNKIVILLNLSKVLTEEENQIIF